MPFIDKFFQTSIVLCAVYLAGCSPVSTPATKHTEIDVSDLVREQGVEPEQSTLLIVRLSDQATWISNSERIDHRYPPASTSKIPHTLIALETGFATAQTPFKWDGTDKGFSFWNQDQTLKTAYARSAVWVYQILTSSLGQPVMSEWITKFNAP